MNGWNKFDAKSLREEALAEAETVISECARGNVRGAAEAWGKAYAYGWVLYRNYGIDLDQTALYAKARSVYFDQEAGKVGA